MTALFSQLLSRRLNNKDSSQTTMFASLTAAFKTRCKEFLNSPLSNDRPCIDIAPLSEDLEKEFDKRYQGKFDFSSFVSRVGVPYRSTIQLEQHNVDGIGDIFCIITKTNIKHNGRLLVLTIKLGIPRNPSIRTAQLLLMSVTNRAGKKVCGKGIGTKVFAELVCGLRCFGFQKLNTFAYKNFEHNGHYTWPRLGFDRPLKKKEKYFCSRKGIVDRSGKEVAMLTDVMESPTGRAWRRKFGGSEDLVFDLSTNSKSCCALRAYLREKGLSSWTKI